MLFNPIIHIIDDKTDRQTSVITESHKENSDNY